MYSYGERCICDDYLVPRESGVTGVSPKSSRQSQLNMYNLGAFESLTVVGSTPLSTA